MAKVSLGSALRRWISSADEQPVDPLEFDAADLDQLLQALFTHSPQLRGYVVDEHGRLRHHVTVFVDNTVVSSKTDLSQRLGANSEVYIMQALSGG